MAPRLGRALPFLADRLEVALPLGIVSVAGTAGAGAAVSAERQVAQRAAVRPDPPATGVLLRRADGPTDGVRPRGECWQP